jgi:hypothetical protein
MRICLRAAGGQAAIFNQARRERVEEIVRRKRLQAQPRRSIFCASTRAGALLIAVTAAASCRHGADDAPLNSAPVAHDDLARTRPEMGVYVDALANDVDDGDSLTVQITSTPAHATVAVTPQNLIHVVPAEDFVGRIDVDYTVSDAEGAVSASARVTVSVEPTARALVSVASAFHLADTTGSQFLGTRSCGELAAPEYSATNDLLVLMVCDTGDRHQLITVRPRAVALQPPVTLLRGESLLSTMVLSDDGQRVVALRSIGDPGDDIELLSIATTDGSLLRRWPVPPDMNVIGVAGGGSADRIILHSTQRVAGSTRWEMATVDVVAGTFERTGPLTTRPQFFIAGAGVSDDGRLFVYDHNGETVLLYDTVQPRIVQTLWPDDPLELLHVIGLVPGAYDALVEQRSGRLPPPPGVPGPPGIPLSAPTLWRVPAHAPLVRQPLVSDYTWVAVRSDGERLAHGRRIPGDPPREELREIDLADGNDLDVLTPQGGVPYPINFEYVGGSEDLLLVTPDATHEQILYLVRRNEAGTMHRLAADRQYRSPVYFASDLAATVVAFAIKETPRAYRVFLADMNAPDVSVPLDVPGGADSDAFVYRVFGSPVPR